MAFGAFMSLWILCRYLKQRREDRARSFSRMRTELVFDSLTGRSGHFIPYKERYVFICTAQNYRHGFRELKNPNRDGSRIGGSLQSHGYQHDHILCIYDATKANFEDGLTKLVQQIQGKDRVLVLIFLSGHGVQVLDSLYWAGVDAVKNDYKTYVNLAHVYERLQVI